MRGVRGLDGATHLALCFVVLVVIGLHHDQVLSVTGKQGDLPRRVPAQHAQPIICKMPTNRVLE